MTYSFLFSFILDLTSVAHADAVLTILDAGRLFTAMKTLVVDGVKRFQAVIPQPEGKPFGNCKIKISAGPGIRISESLQTIDVNLQNESLGKNSFHATL